MVFVGIDRSEHHHDVCVVDGQGRQLATVRVPEGLDGVIMLHETIADHAEDPGEVIVGIEIDRGAPGERPDGRRLPGFRGQPAVGGSVPGSPHHLGRQVRSGDAKVLADLVRTDRHNHRPVAGDSELAEEIKPIARVHQSFIWERQRHVNRLRSALREFYPQALEPSAPSSPPPMRSR